MPQGTLDLTQTQGQLSELQSQHLLARDNFKRAAREYADECSNENLHRLTQTSYALQGKSQELDGLIKEMTIQSELLAASKRLVPFGNFKPEAQWHAIVRALTRPYLPITQSEHDDAFSKLVDVFIDPGTNRLWTFGAADDGKAWMPFQEGKGLDLIKRLPAVSTSENVSRSTIE